MKIHPPLKTISFRKISQTFSFVGILRCALLLPLFPIPAWALMTSDGVGTHVVDPSVPAFGVNLDGVVKIGPESFPNFVLGTGALISDNHILTAAHVIESEPFLFSVRFELAGGPVWLRVKGYAIHPNYIPGTIDNDIAVLELESAAPAGVPRYELHSQSDEIGKSFVIAGYGLHGAGSSGAQTSDDQKRAGLNRFEASGAQIIAKFEDTVGFEPAQYSPTQLYFDFDSGMAANDLGSVLTETEDLGFGNDEVSVAPGDSGGPSFIEGGDNVFRIAGVTATRNSTTAFASYDFDAVPLNSSWGEFAAVTRVSAYLAFVNDAVAGNLRRQRIFDDGAVHVVNDGLDAGPITVLNSPAPASNPTTVTIENSIASDFGSGGVVIAGSSLVEFQDGRIEGYPAVRVSEDARFEMTGGLIKSRPKNPNAFIDTSWAIHTFDNAEIRISGGTLEGSSKALLAAGNSRLWITNGSFSGVDQALSLDGTTIAEINGGTFSSTGVGVLTGSESSVTIRGGNFQGDADGGRSSETSSVSISAGGYTGGSTGFTTADSSQVEINGGTFNAPFAVFTTGTSAVKVSGGIFTGTTDAFQVSGTSLAEIGDGTFDGTIIGIRTASSGTTEINGGLFSAQYAGYSTDASKAKIKGGNFTGSVSGYTVDGTAAVELKGGTFTGTEFNGLFATDNSKVKIFGGAFNGGEAAVASDVNAELQIYGYRFDRPLGMVLEDSGTISGTYFDGTPFSFNFERYDSSVITLVSGFEGWAAFHDLEGNDALATADPNANGLPNALDLVFGSNPALKEGGTTPFPASELVTVDFGDGDEEYLKVSFPVTTLSLDLGAVAVAEYGSELSAVSWTNAVDGVNGVVIEDTVDGISPGVHRRDVWLPKSLAPDGTLFARTQVTIGDAP